MIAIDGLSYPQSVDYDGLSRPELVTYPEGETSFVVKNIYNPYGYLAEVRNNSDDSLLKRIDSLTDRGQVSRQTLGNGTETNISYQQSNGWLSTITVSVMVSSLKQKLMPRLGIFTSKINGQRMKVA